MNKGFIWKVGVLWEVVQSGITGSSGREHCSRPGRLGCTPDSWEHIKPLKTILFPPVLHLDCLADIDTHQQ